MDIDTAIKVLEELVANCGIPCEEEAIKVIKDHIKKGGSDAMPR